MIAIVCTLLSAVAFYISVGLGDQWWLAWIAPIPILWLAFGDTKAWHVFFAAWAALALGTTSLLRAYAGLLPVPVLFLIIFAPSLSFAASVMGARRVQRTLGPVAAMVAFAALWTAFDFLASFSRAGGTASTPAATQVGAPLLMQSASLVGFLGITFLLGFVAAGLALGLRTRNPVPALLAVALFAANAAYGYWRLSIPPTGSIRVALIDSNDTMGPVNHANREAALKDIDAYAAQIAKLADARVQLIVLPENIAQIAPAWRSEAQARLAHAAAQVHATLVAGFNTRLDGAQRNVSWAFAPGSVSPVTYEKRRLVPVLETAVYAPGPGPKVLADGTGLEICKDMDFQAMIRSDTAATRPALLAVPAWDFGLDDWSHARIAVLRSVENGVPMARSARNGLLTLNDRYGRLVAAARTVGGFKVVTADLPLAGRGGATLYDRIGDVLGWLSIALGLALVAASLMRNREAVPGAPRSSVTSGPASA
ncbi:MAG TPA: nitrilase-related carbon-nitrogen hydrolase [Rhizomicrobium sp.]|jgi:apolipoprotein N-acyltransferase